MIERAGRDATRAEHVRWCKQRAREYLDIGNAPGAVASMVSDLGKHPETKEMVSQQNGGIAIGGLLGIATLLSGGNTLLKARDFIEGFSE